MDNIKRFETLLRLTGKNGIEQLIQYYRHSDFYTTWASSSYHCNYKGGLLQHSLNVCDYAMTLHKGFNSKVDIQSVMFCALTHDTGKSGSKGDEYYVPNTLKSGNISGTKPIKINPNLRIKNHAWRSVLQLSKYVDLTEDEKVCIINHDGFYQAENRQAMLDIFELLYIVHNADLYVARFVEPVKNYKRGDVIDL